jgi:hypothetical protein
VTQYSFQKRNTISKVDRAWLNYINVTEQSTFMTNSYFLARSSKNVIAVNNKWTCVPPFVPQLVVWLVGVTVPVTTVTITSKINLYWLHDLLERFIATFPGLDSAK